ncbi:MAG: serine protease [Cyanobacteria bacterium P01_H01_bin.150]
MVDFRLASAFRPTLLVKNGSFELPDDWEESNFRLELENYKNIIENVLPSVGRINLSNSDLTTVGTCWLIADDVVVTNAHVAKLFSEISTNGFNFKGRIRANVDFKAEYFSSEKNTFEVTDIIYVNSRYTELTDLAFLKIDKKGKDENDNSITLSAKPLKLIQNDINIEDIVVTIGFPITEGYTDTKTIRLIKQYFEFPTNSSKRKRIAPGSLLGVDRNQFSHDCSTLRGNSGSPIIKLNTGEVIGTHSEGTSDRNQFNSFIASEFVLDYYKRYA